MKINKTAIVALAIGLAALTTVSAQGNAQKEKAAPIVRGIGGDIPDSQVFINYASQTEAYKLVVPEGWGMTGSGPDMKFVSKFNGVRVEVMKYAGPLSLDNVKADIVPLIEKDNRAVSVTNIGSLSRKGGDSIVVSFEANSDVNPVTNKQIRLEDKAYIFLNNGKAVILTLWAPYGADNVDQWNLISNSFRWL